MLAQYPRTVVTVAFILATLLIVIGLIYPRFLMRKAAPEVPAVTNTEQSAPVMSDQSASVINSDGDPDPEYVDQQSDDESQDGATSSIELM